MTAIKSDISLISLVCQGKPTVSYQLWHKGGKEEANLKENEIKAFLKGKTAVDFLWKRQHKHIVHRTKQDYQPERDSPQTGPAIHNGA